MASALPWFPMPIRARLTRSLALASLNGSAFVDPFADVRIVGMALAAAENNVAFFIKDRRDDDFVCSIDKKIYLMIKKKRLTNDK